MVQGKLLSLGDDLTDALLIRRKVFVDELKHSDALVFDDEDSTAMHVVAYDEDTPVAAGRLLYDYVNSLFTIQYVCTLKESRNKSYGDFVVRMLVDRAILAHAKHIDIICPVNCFNFFSTIGFKENGELFDNNCKLPMVLYPKDFKTCCGNNPYGMEQLYK